ncbi:hypothetical protein WJX77_010604 [Trebouxia sp. C0004]
MDTQIPASGSPTPEALLGMLGKLKRTLTRELSEQRRTSIDKGYISAAVLENPGRNRAPNLLRPSPGLDFLAEKTALSDREAERPRSPVAAGLELESAAPPVDLDRSSRLGSSPLPHLPLPNLSTYTLPPLESSESAQDTFNLEDSREKDGSVTLATSPADTSAASVADLTDKDRLSKPASNAEDATDAGDILERGRAASSITPAEVLTLQGSRDESGWSAKTDMVTQSEAAGPDSTSSGPLQGPQEQQERPVEGQQEVQADAGSQVSGPAPMPVTEAGLDNAMEELALEVSQLQPGTSALVSQGSYLQRHTSCLILKMSQNAAMPLLPAVAQMGAAAKSETSSSQLATPGHVAKASDPQKTIKSMAASLFRACDDGRLKERAPAPAALSGAPAQAEHTLAATLRTYRSSPPKRREASTPPPARTSSYASRQQASLRRSLSPHARQQTSASRKRPEWDASKPSQPSPERAERAADAVDQAIATGICLNSQPSPQRAQSAVAGSPIQIDGHLGAQHAVRRKLPGGLQAQNAGQFRGRASELDAAASHVNSGSSHQAAESGAVGLPLETPSSSAVAHPASISDHGVPSRSLKGQAGKGQLSPTPLPPGFRRLPSNSILDRPAWASQTQPRATAAAVPSQASSLRRSAGSRTVTASNERMQRQTATGSRQMEGGAAGMAGNPASIQGVRLAADADTDMLGQADPQASADSHADCLTDAHAHAHAQALQRLQQAVEEYNSSSPHVLVPTAVELTAALRQAAKRPGQLGQSVEDLRLAGLTLKHEAGDSPCADIPMSPWPAWVKGAWGSPRAPGGVPTALPGVPGKQTQRAAAAAAAAMPCDSAGVVGVDAAPMTRDITPQHAQHGLRHGRAAAPEAAWSPMKKPESASSSRDKLVRRALAEAEAAAARNPSEYPRRPRGRSQPSGAAAGRTRTSATPPRPSIKPSRASATPPRAAITPPRTGNPPQPALPASDKARQRNNLHAALGQVSNLVKRPSVKRSQAGGSRKQSWQPTSAAPHLKGHPESEVPIVEGRPTQSAHQSRPVHCEASSLQSPQRDGALEDFGIAPSAQHVNAVQSHRVRLTSEDDEESLQLQQSMQAEANDGNHHLTPNLSPGPSTHAALAPAHSVTSVAALRQCFEQRGSPTVGLIDSVKQRNRLPLRKVSSKAHVVTDDGSPQQAALLWQQSLRGDPDKGNLGVEHPAEHHAECDKADHGSGGQPSHAGHAAGRHEHTGMAGVANTNVPHLYHTMSALVSQRQASPRVSTSGMPIRASMGTGASPADQSHSVSPSRLTEVLLAAADDVTSSAEKLPVSHRLPVSRSVFDSDEGSLVSSDEEVPISNKGTASANPQGCQAQQPLTEEATLALLPDRGMSPVSESSGDQAASGSGQRRESESARSAGLSGPQRAQHMPRSNADTRHEVYPWRAMAWAHGPSWCRVICKLLPSPPPHFAHPLGPHLLQTSLGLHGADAKNYAFDQVLLEDCCEADVAQQASGVVEAVLQGRNSVVLALGQAGSGKSHTMLGGALHDVDASSSTGLSTILVESLFLEIQQRQLPAEVQSVYVTAFQIMNETIQDLLQVREAEVKQSHRRGGSASDRHDVFMDKQKRTWVSNLAAFQISTPADFANMLSLISGRRHQSSSSHPHMYMSHAPSSCVITLLVTADVPTASVPSSAKRRSSNPQSGTQSQGLPAMTRVCSKLSFVEVGSSAVAGATGPMRTVSAGALRHQLSRTSTRVSTVSSYARCSSMRDRRQSLPSGEGPIRNGAAGSRGVGRGKAQDSTMRSVSEVVWAAAHGKGVPVPNRACKLTRYLRDTLCPSGRAVGIMCMDPAISAQAVGMPTLAASERMMPSQA